ncbi:hypothetical protein ABPG74_006587 [Tetrahymena malaccensis]
MEKVLLLLFSFIFYGINICHIYLVSQLFKQGYIAFFVCYIVLFAIDKIITIYLMLSKYGFRTSNFIFILMDIFQIGFIYYFFSKLKFSFSGIIATKLFGRVYPLLLLDLVFFFGIHILGDRSAISLDLINLAYSIFVILVIFSGILNDILYENFKIKQTILSVIHQAAHYFSISQAILLYDPLGINLGFYYIVLLLLNFLYIFYKNIENRKYGYFLLIGLNYCLNNYFILNYQIDEDYNYNSKATCVTLSYLNFLAQLGLLTGYYFSKTNFYDNPIYLVNQIFAMTFIILFLIFKCKLFVRITFQEQQFWISKENQLKSCIQFMNKSHKFIKTYHLRISYQNFHMIYEIQEKVCQFYYLQKAISQLLIKKNIRVVFSYQSKPNCTCKLKQVLMEEEFIHDSNWNYIQFQVVPIFGNELFLVRLSKGFLFSEATTILIRCIENSPDLNLIKSQILSITCFVKQIQKFMLINPSNVLYDLYDQVY